MDDELNVLDEEEAEDDAPIMDDMSEEDEEE